MWVYLWNLFSVSLIYISDFVPVPYYFEYSSSVVQPEVREINSSDSSFLSEDCLAIQNFFGFPQELQPRQHIKKQRHYFANKGPSSKGYGFSSGHVWMWESEHRRIYAFELWCWRRLMRVPWTARRSNQSILKISSGCSLEGLMKLKLQYFGHLMWRVTHLKRPWCWERLRARGEGNNRGLDAWVASNDSMDMGLGGLWQLVMDRKALHAAVHRVTKTQLSDWTELNWYKLQK